MGRGTTARKPIAARRPTARQLTTRLAALITGTPASAVAQPPKTVRTMIQAGQRRAVLLYIPSGAPAPGFARLFSSEGYTLHFYTPASARSTRPGPVYWGRVSGRQLRARLREGRSVVLTHSDPDGTGARGRLVLGKDAITEVLAFVDAQTRARD